MTGSPAEAGVVRLAVQDIFHRIRSQSTHAVAAANVTPTNDNIDGTREYLVRVSYLEIYNEQIYDLLAQPSPSPSKFKSSLQHHHHARLVVLLGGAQPHALDVARRRVRRPDRGR